MAVILTIKAKTYTKNILGLEELYKITSSAYWILRYRIGTITKVIFS